jgi:hypothetical protein
MLAQYQVPITLAIGLLITATFIGMGLVVRQWRRGRALVPMPQVWLRLTGGLAIQGLWVMLAVLMLHPALPGNPALAMRLFYGSLALVGVLPILALVDVWLTMRSQVRAEAQLTGEFAEFVARLKESG